MTTNKLFVYGQIVGYSFDKNSKILSLEVAVKFNGKTQLVSVNRLTYGTEYELLCQRLCLYRKDGTVNLEFLNGTYVTATMIENGGIFIMKEIQLDALMYQ